MLVVGAALLALVTATACGKSGLDNGGGSTTKVTKKAPKNLKVGASLSTLSNPFFVSVKKGINDLADKKKAPACKSLMPKTIPPSKIMTWKI